ncbi:hypothetical protein GTY23_10040 [Streptomyces sp. SID5998]|nr:hypothetical protein [Streptomyces sp. SID5998]
MEFRATVHSDRLRFHENPETAVRFPGAGQRTSTSRSERTNLPGKVAAGQDYRDATVAYRLATRLTGRPEEGDQDDQPPDPDRP